MTSALVVIDVQSALFDPAPRPADAEAVLARIAALAASARAAHVPVVWVHHEQAGSPLARHSPGWALATGLEAAPEDTVVHKTTPDSFLRTDLADRLAERGVRELVVCGYASEFCVDTTVRSAAARGFAVRLVADAHTTHDKPHASGAQIRAHENATLPAIRSFGVPMAVVPADAVRWTAPPAA